VDHGRCAGCGKVGRPDRIRAHCASCPEFAVLYQRDRASIGTVEEEYENWVVHHRDAEKAIARDAQVADTDARRAAMAERFRTRDPLEG
jgi:hypothetical protein